MTQINIRIEEEEDEILTFLANQKKIPKTAIARELLLDALSQKIVPILLDLYRNGKIGLKKLITLSHLPPQQVLQKIAEAGIEPPISDAIDDYTEEIRKQLSNAVRDGQVRLKKVPLLRKNSDALAQEELDLLDE